jgi:metalloendopeptidase OMA1, mitochondrial
MEMYKKIFGKNGVALLAAVISLTVISCYTVPQTGRSSFNVVSSSDELKLGISAFDEIKRKERISSNAAQTEMVRRVGQRIASVADKDLPNSQWEFVLFENDEPNAFALPGGKVGVYTGILPITKNDSGLAAVLGHEIAHVSARHGGERMSQQLALAGAATGLSIGLGSQSRQTQQLALGAFGLGTTLAVTLPFSRSQESEADHIGLIYMAKAGYNPREAVDFWRRFQAYNERRGGRPPAFLATHPADDKRIRDLEAELPEAEVYYKTSGRK